LEFRRVLFRSPGNLPGELTFLNRLDWYSYHTGTNCSSSSRQPIVCLLFKLSVARAAPDSLRTCDARFLNPGCTLGVQTKACVEKCAKRQSIISPPYSAADWVSKCPATPCPHRPAKRAAVDQDRRRPPGL